MRKVLFVLGMIFISFIGNSQAPAIQWQKCLGGSGQDSATSIKQTFDGGYIVCGTTNSTDGNVVGNHGGKDAWIIKLNNAGNIVWSRCIGGSADDYGNWIEQTKDSGYIVCGNSNSTDGDLIGNHGYEDAWIFKLNKNGSIIWKKIIGGSNNDNFVCIKEDKSGNYIACGGTSSFDGDLTARPSTSGGLWIVKINFSGSIINQRFSYVAAGASYFSHGGSGLYKMILTLDSGYIFSSYAYGTSGAGTSLEQYTKFSKFDKFDSLTNFFVGGLNPSFFQTVDSGYIVAGNYYFNGNYYFRHFNIRKTDKFFNQNWNINYYTCSSSSSSFFCKNDILEASTLQSNGNLLLAGETYGSNCENCNLSGISPNHNHDTLGTTLDFWIMGLDSAGSLLWHKCYGGSGNEITSDIQTTMDGGSIIVGITNSNDGDVSGNHGNSDIWVVKLAPSPLPLKLLSFTAKKENNNVMLNWKTANEINVSSINIQRSINGNNFNNIGKLNASCCNYKFTDDIRNLGLGISSLFYRLEIVDKDGSKTYSTIQQITIKPQILNIIIYPNPAKDLVTIECTGAKGLLIIDYLGRTIKQFNNITQPQTVNCKQLSRGIYVVKAIMNNGEVKTEKLIIE